MTNGNGWYSKKLGELCRIELGRTPSRANSKLWDASRESSNVWLSIADLLAAEENVVGDSKEYVSDAGAALCKTVRQGTLLVSFKLTLGRVAFAGRDLFTNEAIAALDVVDETKLSKEYLFYFLQFFDWHKAAAGDVKIKGKTLNKAKLKQIVVSFPPLPEQQRIVGILDEAFAAIATAKANAEKNLQNARDVFTSFLHAIFSHEGAIEAAGLKFDVPSVSVAPKPLVEGTKTGGRAATERHIPGPLSLAVNCPRTPAKPGWQWRRLTDLARLETGHTPSRRHPEWWGGEIPWIGIKDARDAHGETITETLTNTNPDGIANSAARVLPAGTVCLSRTASVGYVTVMGREMATSQDFVNWVCSDQLEPHFLKYLLLAEGEGIRRFGYGSVHTTIYFPEVKAFYVCCPLPDQQRRIIAELDEIKDAAQRLGSICHRKLAALDALKKSLLHHAFTGQL